VDTNELVKLVKANKKYKDISDEVVKTRVEEFLAKNKVFEEKSAVKEIRSRLHRIHGSFRLNTRKLEKYLKNKEFRKILESNRSTRERLDVYSELYADIFEMTGKPTSIIDLGCGLNPVSILYMDLKHVNYHAYDINESEIKFLNDFFKEFSINGQASILDLSKIENVTNLPRADLCLAFKLVDLLEAKGHKYSEELIKILAEKCKFLVVSFATRTISGKNMNYPARGWIERMLERIGFKFEILEFDEASEIFYVIKK